MWTKLRSASYSADRELCLRRGPAITWIRNESLSSASPRGRSHARGNEAGQRLREQCVDLQSIAGARRGDESLDERRQLRRRADVGLAHRSDVGMARGFDDRAGLPQQLFDLLARAPARADDG